MESLFKKIIFLICFFISLPVFADGWVTAYTDKSDNCLPDYFCGKYAFSFDRDKMMAVIDKYNLVLQQVKFHPVADEGGLFKDKYAFKLAGYQLREWVFMLQAYDSAEGMNVVDFKLPSKDAAEDFCDDLRTAFRKDGAAQYVLEAPLLNSLPIVKVIAVGIGTKRDGISADKHYFCPNPWGWVPHKGE